MPAEHDASCAELERLGDEIATLAADLHAVTYRLLTRVREFDTRGGWGWGFLSCAQWLSWRTGIAPGAAREKVRVAHALAELPRISAAMVQRASIASGKLSRGSFASDANGIDDDRSRRPSTTPSS